MDAHKSKRQHGPNTFTLCFKSSDTGGLLSRNLRRQRNHKNKEVIVFQSYFCFHFPSYCLLDPDTFVTTYEHLNAEQLFKLHTYSNNKVIDKVDESITY